MLVDKNRNDLFCVKVMFYLKVKLTVCLKFTKKLSDSHSCWVVRIIKKMFLFCICFLLLLFRCFVLLCFVLFCLVGWLIVFKPPGYLDYLKNVISTETWTNIFTTPYVHK